MDSIYVLGSGGSLIGFDFSLLNGKNVICCNHAYKVIKDPLNVIYIDNAFITELKPNEFDQLKRLGDKVYSPDPYLHGMTGQFRRYTASLVQTEDFNKVLKIDSCGHTAVSLALKYKPKTVYLLGIDNAVLTKEQLNDCFSENTNGEMQVIAKEVVHFSENTDNHRKRIDTDRDIKRLDKHFGYKTKAFDMFKSYNIVNLSKYSSLTQFKKESLKEHFFGGTNK